jgi:hypothetical protein
LYFVNFFGLNNLYLLVTIIIDMKGKIRVFCRLRPLNEKEQYLEEKNIVCSPDEFTIAHPWKDDKSKQHIYDRVFDASTTQEEVFEDTKVIFFYISLLC